jgi:oligopeptide transport system substrate-binding protein
MVSNGPFTLAEFTPNDKIKLVKNPKFYDAASVKLDVVNYMTAEDRSAAMKRFEAGELDSNNDFPTEQLAELKAKFGGQVRISPLLGTYYYVFKSKKDPWSNVKLRHAIALVIDRDYLAEKVWQNAMIPAYSMVPPGVAGYTPSMTDYADKSQLDREDEAKKVFTELGISPEKPMKLELRYNTSDNHKNTAVAIQDMLKPFGFELTLTNTDGKTHYSFLEQKGNFDIARVGWNADYKDPETFLDLAKTGAGNNYGEYSNKEYDDLLSAAAGEADAPKRMALLSKAEAILMRDLPVMPLLYYSCHNIVSDKIKGFEENVMDIHPSRFISKE